MNRNSRRHPQEPPRDARAAARQAIDHACRVVLVSSRAAGALIDDLREVSRGAATPHADPAEMLVDEVMTAVGHCWEAGWQPLDIVHVIRRHGTPMAADWIASAIVLRARDVEQLDLAPRHWIDQLGILGSSPTPPRLTSRGDWMSGLTVLALLRGLPRIEALMPAPSRWGSATGTPSGLLDAAWSAGSGSADPKVMARIRALLAKAESTEFAAEAEAFTAKAQDIMTRHAIDAALVSQQSGASIGVVGRRIHIDSPYPLEKAVLLHSVAEANRVSAVWNSYAQHVTIIGTPTDVGQVEMLFTSLLIQATRAMTEAGQATGHGVDRSRLFRRTFMTAYANRIGQRLTKAAEETVATYGGELVPVLVRQREAVAAETERLFPHVTTSTRRRTHSARGWDAGTSAADRAVLPAGEVDA